MAKAVFGSQIPLNLKFLPEQRFATFVDGDEAIPSVSVVEHAVAASDATPHLLQGASESGKTHLLLAACYAARESGRTVAFVPLKQMRDRIGEVGAGASLIAIDDLDAIAGDLDAQVALFHLLNAAKAADQSVLISTVSSPNDLDLQLPDLRSRLNACVRVPLTLLADEGRKKALQLRALSRGLEFDDAAIDWLLLRADRSIANLMSLFRQLDHASSVRKKKLTLPFVREILSEQL